MKNTLIVVMDLGLLKAYRLERTQQNTPRLVLVEELTTAEAHSKLTDKLSDQAGRYRVPTSNMAMSFGERQKIDLEFRKRLVKQLAEQLSRLLNRDGVEECYVAASKEINHFILDALGHNERAKIVINLPADLTKVEKTELLDRFQKAAPAVA